METWGGQITFALEQLQINTKYEKKTFHMHVFQLPMCSIFSLENLIYFVSAAVNNHIKPSKTDFYFQVPYVPSYFEQNKKSIAKKNLVVLMYHCHSRYFLNVCTNFSHNIIYAWPSKMYSTSVLVIDF